MHVDYYFNGKMKGAGQDAIAAAIAHFGPDKIKSITSRFAQTNRNELDKVLASRSTDLFHATPQQINEAIALTPGGRTMSNLGFGKFSYEIKGTTINVTFTK
jgi:hypothetical protein